VNFEYALDRLEEALPEGPVPDHRWRTVHDRGLVPRFLPECRRELSSRRRISARSVLACRSPSARVFAVPDRPVVLFTGDGGFMMGGINEFNTAVRMKQDLIVIVANDSAYGAEHIQFLDRKMDPGCRPCSTGRVSPHVATALGGQGILVQSNDELEGAIEGDRNTRPPLLIELRLDPNDVPRMRM
jgi:acetolactate synthase-1/2/3 large subunit